MRTPPPEKGCSRMGPRVVPGTALAMGFLRRAAAAMASLEAISSVSHGQNSSTPQCELSHYIELVDGLVLSAGQRLASACLVVPPPSTRSTLSFSLSLSPPLSLPPSLSVSL